MEIMGIANLVIFCKIDYLSEGKYKRIKIINAKVANDQISKMIFFRTTPNGCEAMPTQFSSFMPSTVVVLGEKLF